jgi:hypothetical protein
MQDVGFGLLRIPLPRTLLNKGPGMEAFRAPSHRVRAQGFCKLLRPVLGHSASGCFTRLQRL